MDPLDWPRGSLRPLALYQSNQAHLTGSPGLPQGQSKGQKVWPKKAPILGWNIPVELSHLDSWSRHLDSWSKQLRSAHPAYAAIHLSGQMLPGQSAGGGGAGVCSFLECSLTGCWRNAPLAAIWPKSLKTSRHTGELKNSKSLDPDGMHPRDFREVKCEIVEFNQYVSHWCLKKRGEPRNYRSVSLTSVPGKSAESDQR